MSTVPKWSFASRRAMQRVGRLIKVIGVNRGIVSVWHDPFVFEQIPHQKGNFIFIAIDGLFVPFQIRESEKRADGSAVLYFQELSDGITADELVGRELYLPAEQLQLDPLDEEEEDTFSLDMFIGCHLKDQCGNAIGEIVDYEQYSLNMLLVVERANGEEVLIPFHPDLVLRLPSAETDELQLQIADGLLDS